MEKSELYNLRKNMLENKDKFTELNDRYNELLVLRREKNKKDNNTHGDSKVKKISIKIDLGWLAISSLLILYFEIPTVLVLVWCFTYPILSSVLESFVIPRILYGKDYKVKRKSKTPEKVDMDSLYDEVYEARKSYHELHKEYEDILNKLTNEDLDAYLEYLKEGDSYIELLEAESTRENVTLNDTKQKELKNANE